MISQQLVGVVLPSGLAPDGLQSANVFLSPRLSGAQLLSDFPDWLDWTNQVQANGISFDLACAGNTTTVTAATGPLRPDIWEAIFGHDSLVEQYPEGGFENRLVVSYPTRDVETYLSWAYRSWAQYSLDTSDDGSRALFQVLGGLVFRDDEGKSTLDQTLSETRVAVWNQQHSAADAPTAVAPVPMGPNPTPAAIAWMARQVALYHRMPPAPNRPSLPTGAELAKLVDFHKALTALGSYPELLQLLGLVFPISLPTGFCPDSPGSGSSYETLALTAIHPGWTWHSAPTVTTPATAYVAADAQFAPAPATDPATLASSGPSEASDIVYGFLALTPADFHLVGVDVDGAMLKLLAFADSWSNAGEDVADMRFPSLRSSGLSLIADGRAQELLRAIHDNAGFGSIGSRPLNARDVTRGYRLDIFTARNERWESLHRRDGTYRFGDSGLTLTTHDEEGFVQLAVAQPADDPSRKPDSVATAAGIPQPSTDIYLGERVARWNGWSLSAPRPALPINRSADPSVATTPDPTADGSPTTFSMTSSFVAHPRSLPSLRFGERYRIRARAVDLAGHSVGLEAPIIDALAAPPDGLLPFFRWEPVGPPVVVLRQQPGPGGSLLQMVIRTHNTDPSLDTLRVADIDERHIAPPGVGEQLVEQHGMFDGAGGPMRGAIGYTEVTTLDRGGIPTVGQTPLVPGPTVDVDYLSDPIARGAAFTSLPQTEPATDGVVTAGSLAYAPAPGAEPRPTGVTQISFGTGWPGREALRLRLVDAIDPPSWDAAGRVLTVSLAKAQTATVPLSCFTSADDLNLFGIWDWLRQLFESVETSALSAGDAGFELVDDTNLRTLLTALTLAGNNELITPSVDLTLTHAVQQPLGLPIFTRLPIVHNPAAPVAAATLANQFSPITAWRSAGSHHAVLLGALQINGASTAAIDIDATWTEWIDDPSQPAPETHPGSSHVDRIVLSSLDEGSIAADGNGGAGRQVANYLPQIDALWFSAPFDALDSSYPPPTEIAAPIHKLEDAKHRLVHYRATASSRFQEYFPEPGAVTFRTGPALPVSVPSSARPLAPDVAYVVPAFGWDQQVTTDTKTELRYGNLLRVYLNRPWYSSGVGELLGVVLWPSSAGAAPTDDQRIANKALITQWGLDPAWAPGEIEAVPSVEFPPGDFPLATNFGSSLTVEGTAQVVDVAGHEVGFDTTRGLWYCDIQFENPGAYTPFVRLALARYQPHSITGVELSKVVIADFAQLTPDRSVAITMDPADPTRARIVVAGLAPSAPTQSFFTVAVESRRADVLTDLGWEPAAPAAVQISPDPVTPKLGSALLSTTVTFAQPPPTGQYRAVVKEFEVIESDPPDTALTDGPVYADRLVFAATVPFDHPTEATAS